MDVKTGDLVKISFPGIKTVLRINTDTITGRVESVFDALTPTGEQGINLEIDIRFGPANSYWFRYKPMKDKGTLTLIAEDKTNE